MPTHRIKLNDRECPNACDQASDHYNGPHPDCEACNGTGRVPGEVVEVEVWKPPAIRGHFWKVLPDGIGGWSATRKAALADACRALGGELME
jgi:hypothetical protein